MGWTRHLVVVVIFAGCTSSITPETYSAAIRDANCDLRVRCGQFTDRDSCAAYFPVGDGANLAAEIAAGKTTFDANRAEECVNDIRNTPCDGTSVEARTPPAACDAAIAGTGVMGDPCFSNDECKSGGCALDPTCTGMCCAGTCSATQAPADLGEPCATRQCKPNLTCSNAKTCVPLYADGMPCDDDSQCDYGLGCVGAPGICHALPKIGELCPDGECAEIGATCNNGVCTKLGLTGASCATLADCSLYYPCNSGTLQCQPWPKTGEPCTALCSDGSFCDSTTNVCTSPLGNGATCKSDDQCASTSCNATKVCADVQVCEAT
jgi:hypothetical protein